MKAITMLAIPTIFTLMLTGSQTQNPAPTRTFFQDGPFPKVNVTLHSDPLVQQMLPNVSHSNVTVAVYVPLYPGATFTLKPVSGIGDMGTPMDGDLVDGTLYFKSRDSEGQILGWYTRQFQKIDYSSSGKGSSGTLGNEINNFYRFTKNGTAGDPTRFPNIDLGFLDQQDDGKTQFKLNALYIITPPRPKDTYLPNDIVKVVLTEGQITKTITDNKWISNVVKMINSLQVSTPGISSGGGPLLPGVPTTIYAKFSERFGSSINVTYFLPSWTVEVANTNAVLFGGSYPRLHSDLVSVFGNTE